jgi:hypothetical protein
MLRSISHGAALLAVLLAAACASVSTQIVPLAPALNLAPSTGVEILLEKPKRPHREIALLESRGMVGDTEADLWQDAREKAQAIGADALVRLEVYRTVHHPIVYYDPFLTPYYSPYYPTPYFFPNPFPEYRVIPGGVAYTLKSLAIKYE